MHEELKASPAAWIEQQIREFVAVSPENRLEPKADEKAFDPPLVGFSSGADPLFEVFKQHIGEFYLTPLELFKAAYSADGVQAADLSVISWILPSTRATRKEQAASRQRPSRRWALTRHQGELFNNALRRYVVDSLKTANIPALAPVLSPQWRRCDQGPYAPCSTWSERHAAFAAGLGTFGLCDGLITPVGKAIRTGSIVARIRLPPTPRPYADPHAYCLFFTHQTCKKCISRCPVNALSEAGHHKTRCLQYTEHLMNAYIKTAYGVDTYACGLCQADVPCCDHIPGPDEG
jgi:hypothetical protein